MARQKKPAVAEAIDDSRLLKPPGIFRQFWLRHPRLTDTAVVLLNLPWVLTFANYTPPPGSESPTPAIIATLALAAALLSLFVRRKYPVTVFYISVAGCVLTLPAHLSPSATLLLLTTAYSVAVYASSRAAWRCYAISLFAVAASGVALISVGLSNLQAVMNMFISIAVLSLISFLVGINVGNRRRYLKAILDRSRQLEVERDQQALIAAQSERNRIAREMHDIVSHSLTVIVALSEGAAATEDAARAKTASLHTATTARNALNQMREMLGVLHSDEPDAPLIPQYGFSVSEAVASARAAGFLVETVTHGDDSGLPNQLRFALARVVQESLTNAMRHSPNTSAIKVTISYTDPGISVEVLNDSADDAVPQQSSLDSTLSGGGFGLRGLAERVKLLGGVFEAGRWRGTSWRVFAFLPQQKE